MGFALLLLSSTEGWSGIVVKALCPGSPTSSFPTAKSWTDCFGTFTSSFEYKYVGEYKDGNYHGQGTLTDANGRDWLFIPYNQLFNGCG
jgi:hypothetical protein